MKAIKKAVVFTLCAAILLGAKLPSVINATAEPNDQAPAILSEANGGGTMQQQYAITEENLSLYGSSGTKMTIVDGTIKTTPEGEQKAIINDFSSRLFDVSYSIEPAATNGAINGGLYIYASNPGDPTDHIDALSVNIDRAVGEDNYQLFIYSFNGDSYLGAEAHTIKLRYHGGKVAVRVISDEEFINVYLDGSNIPSITKRISVTPAKGYGLGFRSLNARMTISDVNISLSHEKPECKTVKLLMIGNSYAHDTMIYTHELARAEGINLVCGVLFYGGCTMEQHANFVANRSKVYTYYKNGMADRSKTDFFDVLYDEDWDYLTFQTGHGYGGKEEMWYPYIHDLIALVEKLCPTIEIGLFMSWVAPYYREGAGDYKLAMYNDSTDQMYAATVKCFKDLQLHNGTKFIVPAAVAMHTAHGTSVCDNTSLATSIHRDTTAHANEKGRYLLALTMYRTVTGRRAEGCTFDPVGSTYSSVAGPTYEERLVLQGICDNAFDAYGYETLNLFPEPEELVALRVENAKTTYRVGQAFDYTGMKVYAVYNDGRKVPVKYYQIDKMRKLTASDTEIVISYLGQRAVLPIIVQ